jgi:hypothetical protein
MKRIITQEKQPFFNPLTNELLETGRKTVKEVKTSTINSLLNFSKSLKIVPSSSVKGLELEMIIN